MGKELSEKSFATIIWRRIETRGKETPQQAIERMRKDLENEFKALNAKIIIIPQGDDAEIQLHTQDPSKIEGSFII